MIEEKSNKNLIKMDNLDKIWQNILGELELLISKANFTTWFKNTFIVAISDQEIVIGVPSAFAKVWLERKYHDNIVKALEKTLSKNTRKAMTEIFILLIKKER